VINAIIDNLKSNVITLLAIIFLNACGSDSTDSLLQEPTKNLTNNGSCTATNFTSIKQLISDKGHIIKLVCNGSHAALLMRKHTNNYISEQNVILINTNIGNILFESTNNRVTDINLIDESSLVYTELTHNQLDMSEYRLVYRDIINGEVTKHIIHQDTYVPRDYASVSLKLLPIDDIIVTSYRTINGAPWLSGWKLNLKNEFEQVFNRQIAPALNDVGFAQSVFIQGGSVDVFNERLRQQDIFLAPNPINKNDILMSFSAPALNRDGYEKIRYADLYSDFTEENVSDISTKSSYAGVDVIITNVNTSGHQSGGSVLGTVNMDHNFGLSSYLDRPLIFGRAQTLSKEWKGFLAINNLANADLSLAKNSVISAAKETHSGLLSVASVNWQQNPSGLSISEKANLEFILFNESLNEISKTELAPSNRFDQIYGIIALKNNGYLAYGMQNGPGTHSADSNVSHFKSEPLLIQVIIESDNSLRTITL
jgi:hypothetical protein